MKLRACLWLSFLLFAIFPTTRLRAQSPTEDIFRFPLVSQTQNAFLVTSAQLAAHPLVKGSFEQEKVLSRLNRSLKSSGNFIIAAGQGMVWDTIKPFPSTLVLGKDYLIQERPGGQKTVLSAAGNETFIRMAEVISAVFSGNTRELLENFEVFYSGTPETWQLGLLPYDKSITSFAGRIIMGGDSAIRSIVVYEQNGDAVKYFLHDHNYPKNLSVHEESFFSLP